MDLKEQKLFNEKARLLKAIAHPTRLWIVEKLQSGERCVCEFVDELSHDFSTISKHLSVLKQAGIVSDEKRGKQVYYTLQVPCIIKLINCIQEVMTKNLERQSSVLNK